MHDSKYIIIGNYVNIAWNVTIGPRSHIYTNFTTHDFIYTDRIHIKIADSGSFDSYLNKIGHDVWIGCNAIIMPGVEVGNGVVIAAGSVVTKSIPPYAIVGGSLAKFIKWRFTETQINLLEKSNLYLRDMKKIIGCESKLEKIVGFNITKFKEDYIKKRKLLEIKKDE